MIRRPPYFLFASAFILACGAGAEDTGGHNTGGGGGSDTGGTGSGANANGGAGGSMGNFTGGGDLGGAGGSGGSIVNPCGTECGPTELCDGSNKGLDDNCNGEVDEDCPCSGGEASSCFKGDPSYLGSEGCYPGTMKCTEFGLWGPCEGGNHATDECFNSDVLGCHPISAVPFATTDLTTGVGNFDDDADLNSSTYTVECPQGIDPCPTPNGTDYTALQSGEYTVTYTKEVGGNPESCTFPLYVGARGLRVELSWNYANGADTSCDVFPGLGYGCAYDLDLHLHQPMASTPWAKDGEPQDCGYANCTIDAFNSGDPNAPNWFPPSNQPPDPVNWYDDPDPTLNSCYYAPRGRGADWEAFGQGCHSPRLDLDNISCDPTIMDPNYDGDPLSGDHFCAPENSNIDFPPKDQWMRVGVIVYGGTTTESGTITPTVKIFCDGALAAELGPEGYTTPVTFNAQGEQDRMWVVGDVLFSDDECGVATCIVQPLVDGSGNAVKMSLSQYEAGIGPPYPNIP